MRKYLLLCFLLIANPFHTPGLRGQEASGSHSIIGQVFKYSQPPAGIPIGSMLTFPSSETTTVTLVDGRDTLRAKTGPFAIFRFSDIKSSQVHLTVIESFPTDPPTIRYLFSGTVEIKPGGNIVLIPVDGIWPDLASANDSIVTFEGDDWVFHYPGAKGMAQFAADELRDFPCAKYNRRKDTITIPREGIYRAYTDGVYIFALDPDTSE